MSGQVKKAKPPGTYGAHVTHGLHQVTSQPIGAVVPGWREQTDQIEIKVPIGGVLVNISILLFCGVKPGKYFTY